MEDDKNWRGIHISQLQTSLNHPQYPKLTPSEEHTILIKIPVSSGKTPECYPPVFRKQDYWDENHVKLPSSEKNVTEEQIPHWNLIKDVLNTRISTSEELEQAILSYNKRYVELWNFSSLHSFFDEVLEESETAFFFECLLPKIINLALSLPELITTGIPLLKHGQKQSITLSQLQISCLVANAFLCTFPHRNSMDTEYCDYPDINFNKLFQCKAKGRMKAVNGKLKCLINYFRRVTNSVPTGIVTYSRQFVEQNVLPDWLNSSKKLTHLFVSSTGSIENDGFGLFQVDFANKFVGGGVIRTGCVQEEIRFVICPELILSKLFTQRLRETEALIVTGCERFNEYKGYGDSFEWNGDYVDGTPSDENGRKYCTVIALNALSYARNPYDQYLPRNMLRDINKAYVGFSWGSQRKKEELCAVATGNWGCGVFKGNPQLKSFLQLMAAAEVGRDLAYFTFGDENLRNSMASTYQFLFDNEVTVGKLYNLLLKFSAKQLFKNMELFEFLINEAVQETSSETDCDMTRRHVHNTVSIPRLDVTKSSCCKTKINNPFGLSKTDLPREKTEQNKIEDSVERDLKVKETLTLANLYQSPDNVQSKLSRHEDNFHLILKTFKERFKRPTIRASSQMKEVNTGKKNEQTPENDFKIPSSACVTVEFNKDPSKKCNRFEPEEQSYHFFSKIQCDRVKKDIESSCSKQYRIDSDDGIQNSSRNASRFDENHEHNVRNTVDISRLDVTKYSCNGKEIVDLFELDKTDLPLKKIEQNKIDRSDSRSGIRNISGNASPLDESRKRETEKTNNDFLPVSAEKFVNLSALSNERKPFLSKRKETKPSESIDANFKKRKISDYFTFKDKTI